VAERKSTKKIDGMLQEYDDSFLWGHFSNLILNKIIFHII